MALNQVRNLSTASSLLGETVFHSTEKCAQTSTSNSWVKGPALKIAVFSHECHFLFCARWRVFEFDCWVCDADEMMFGPQKFSARCLYLRLSRITASDEKSGLIIGIIPVGAYKQFTRFVWYTLVFRILSIPDSFRTSQWWKDDLNLEQLLLFGLALFNINCSENLV